MKKDELLYKYLDGTLSPEELATFKQNEEYGYILKLDEDLQEFKAPDYDVDNELNQARQNIKSVKKTKRWMATFAKIAAVLLICFGIYHFASSADTHIRTVASQKQTVELPDGSTAMVNALSHLQFNKNKWKKNRELSLNGEAFFKVIKGSTFTVDTEIGDVTVLGTQFNVKQRDNFFEVVCNEGLVEVAYNKKTIKLPPGNQFLVIDGKIIAIEKENQPSPSWIDGYSQFKSMPYREVIAEFERQYDLDIQLQSIEDSQLFTGSFTHEDMEVALKSITLPLHLTYVKAGNTITLKRE